jgi:Sulfotransferase family
VARPPFPFVVGCGRSGTTLVRAMGDGHPELAVPPESHFVVPMAQHRRSDRPLDVSAFLDQLYSYDSFRLWDLDRVVLEKALADPPPADYPDAVRAVFRAYAHERGKPRYADKTPGYVLHIAALTRLFPEAVFVHVVRDGRDVASSFRELGWADSVEQAALHWRLRVRRGRRAGRALAHGRYHELRYEDLVGDPEGQLRQLCVAIELPFSTAMVDSAARADDVIRTTRHPDYHRRLADPPTPGLRDWRKELREEEVARFELLAGGTLVEFGYERAGVRASPAVRRDVSRRWVHWQLHRVRRRAGRRG